jgi:hypothetical protein
MNRARQRSTADSSTPRSAAACLFVPPSAQASTIFARSARYWAVFARLAHRISCARSASSSTSSALGPADRRSILALDALREGYEVYPVVDAIGGTSPEAHRAGLDRVIQAGGQPISWVSLAVELQRDWARQDTVAAVIEIVLTDRLLKERTVPRPPDRHLAECES